MQSRFTYRDLASMRAIVLIDLDAFYSQVETVRLGLSQDVPLAVQQWTGLIAINYAARKYGITRHESITEALKKCPQLRCVHVATYRQGESEAGYWGPEENVKATTHKVSLDVYRRESIKILEVFRQKCDLVEKASIDESYMDLSNQARQVLYDRYAYVDRNPVDPSMHLPEAPEVIWDQERGHLVDPENTAPVDWDDILLHIAAEVVADIRKEVFDRLKYTCSAGIAPNKMLAKLCAGYRKPNQQTILRPCAVLNFLGSFKFSKIRMLGGKLGDQIAQAYGKELVKEFWDIPLDDLKEKLGEDTGQWFFNIIRGSSDEPVEPKSKTKSMLSAKQFRPFVKTDAEVAHWFHILATDIHNRLLEHRLDNPSRWPRNLILHYSLSYNHRSKSAHFPSFPKDGNFTIEMITECAHKLWRTLELPKGWQCNQLSIAVSGFEEMEQGQRGLGEFFGGNKRKAEGDPEDVVDETRERLKCERCGQTVLLSEQQSHQDEHFARDLLQEERIAASKASAASRPAVVPSTTTKTRSGGSKTSSAKNGKKGSAKPQNDVMNSFFTKRPSPRE